MILITISTYNLFILGVDYKVDHFDRYDYTPLPTPETPCPYGYCPPSPSTDYPIRPVYITKYGCVVKPTTPAPQPAHSPNSNLYCGKGIYNLNL